MRWFAKLLGALHCRWMVLAAGLVLVGTTAAQAVINDIDSGLPVRYPSYITEYDGWLYFRGSIDSSTSDTQLWRSNGVYAQLAPNAGNVLTPSYLAPYNGKLYFAVWNDTRLWQYDPVAGASRAPDAAAQANTPQEMTAYDGNLYYRASNFNTVGTELWKFNSGTQTQTPVDLWTGPGSSYPQHFMQYNGQLYFNSAGSPGPGSELWRTDGTTTAKAATINAQGSSPENFAVHDSKLFFLANDGVHGNELWQFDSAPEPNGTAQLAYDIIPGSGSSNPSSLASYNGKLYFAASDGTGDGKHGNELWSFDGTTATMVAEINTTANPHNGNDFLMDSSPGDLTVFNGKLYFSATDGMGAGEHGRELWSYDSTTDTVSLVADINPGPYGSEVGELTIYKNQLYFAADNGYVPGLNSLKPEMMSLSEVPEPGSFALLAGGGLAWLLWRVRRRRSR